MTKTKTRYVCQSCGSVSAKWSGKCDACGVWDNIIEERQEAQFFGPKKASGKSIQFETLEGEVGDVPRTLTCINEMDRVLGGGLVDGSAILIGGDPGIGKSTLLLQVVVALAKSGVECAYITGEESVDQVKLRAHRLGYNNVPVKLAAITATADIVASLKAVDAPRVVVIDSIQTMYMEGVESAPGTVTQVRASAHELIRVAKQKGITVFLVGHVTKEGQIAGPKVLEHMVDTVLYFEGERGHQFRILRAVKNRFGAANEIGVFEMQDKGLTEVANPSALFLSERGTSISGSSVFAGMEGTRPVLVEVQALVSPTMMATPRRAVVGWDINRLAMILAVLQARYGLAFADKEVYLNVAGGLKVTEPAADLAVAVALISALKDIPLPPKHIVFGEVGLSGEIRQVSHADIRIKEALKLGFEFGITPTGRKVSVPGFYANEVKHIRQLSDIFNKKYEHVG
jgi:DNA repair protein RadA/Sms